MSTCTYIERQESVNANRHAKGKNSNSTVNAVTMPTCIVLDVHVGLATSSD